MLSLLDEITDLILSPITYPIDLYFDRKEKKENDIIKNKLELKFRKKIDHIYDISINTGENKYRIIFSDGEKIEIIKNK